MSPLTHDLAPRAAVHCRTRIRAFLSQGLASLAAVIGMAIVLLAPTPARAQTPPGLTIYPMSINSEAGHGFYVTANITGGWNIYPDMQWQRRAAGSETWLNLVEDAVYTHPYSSQLYVTDSALAMNGDEFRVIATNSDATVYSEIAKLTVTPAVPPSFNGPGDAEAVAGASVSFGLGTYDNFNRQWQALLPGTEAWTDLSDGAVYSGTRTATLTVKAATLAMNGARFRCVAGNSAVSRTSVEAILTVFPAMPPNITEYPASLTTRVGTSVSINPSIRGATPITYQWYHGGDPLVGSSNSWLNISNSQLSDSGTYTLAATNRAGTTTISVPVTVLPASDIMITRQPFSGEVFPGNSFSFSVDVAASGSVTYQWYRNGVAQFNATQSSLYIPLVTPQTVGEYYVVVTGTGGSVTSAKATLGFVSSFPQPPRYEGVTPNLSISSTSSYDLNLGWSLTGTSPMTFKWYKDGVLLNATQNSLWLPRPFTPAQAGVYSVTATNAAGETSSGDVVVTWYERTPPLWLDAVRLGDVVYFLVKNPGRVLRYDLAADAWLAAVDLPEGKVPSAFLPTAEGVFIAYGTELVRRSVDLQTEVPVAANLGAVSNLFAVGDSVFALIGTNQVQRWKRTTLVPGAVANAWFTSLKAGERVAYAASLNRLFIPAGEDMYRRLFLTEDGPPVDDGSIMAQGVRTLGKSLRLSPDEKLLFTDTGSVFSSPEARYVGSLGQRYDDIALLDDGRVVVLRGAKLGLYANSSWAELGQRSLPAAGSALFRRNDTLFVFGNPTGGGDSPTVQRASVGDLEAAVLPMPKDPRYRKFSIDGLFVDAGKVVHVVSRSEQAVIRWDTVSRKFLPSLPLRGRPARNSYAPGAGRLVLAYPDGVLTDLFPTGAPVEQAFAHFPPQNPLYNVVAMDEHVGLQMATDTPGGGDAFLVIDAYGKPATFHPWALKLQNRFSTWTSSTRRFYFESYDTGYSRQLSFLDFLPEGTAPAGYSGESGVVNNVKEPLRANADGTLLVTGNGRILKGTLQDVGSIPATLTDAAWLADGLYTTRTMNDGTLVQKWAAPNYGSAGEVTLPGFLERIFPLDDTHAVVITTVDGYAVFHVLTNTLQVTTVFNHPGVAPERPALFNADAYLANNPDVAAAIGDTSPDRAQQAWSHYWRFGMGEGRTDGDFNVQAYLAQYPDLAALYAGNPQGAALHWYTTGRAQGLRVPAGFDVNGYFARNSDIAGLFTNDRYGAWLHYYNYGLFEGRSFDANFIPAEYLELNQDLKTVFGSNLQAAVMHWFNYGHPIEDRMGRVPIGFNVDSYLARYPDLAAVFAGITPTAVRNVTVWHHYLAYGTLEGRSDGDFEAYHYLATNPDLAGIFGSDIQAAALHWYFYGRREGRRIPGGFNVQNYRSLYPDIVLVYGDDLYGSWIHYRDNGVFEGRVYDDLFRPADYLALNPDVAAAIGTNYRDALLHWLFYGQYEGRSARNN